MFGLFVYWKNQQNIEFWVFFFFLGKLFPTLNNKIKYDIYQTHIKVVGNQTTLRNLQTPCNKHLSFVKFRTYFAYIYIYILYFKGLVHDWWHDLNFTYKNVNTI